VCKTPLPPDDGCGSERRCTPKATKVGRRGGLSPTARQPSRRDRASANGRLGPGRSTHCLAMADRHRLGTWHPPRVLTSSRKEQHSSAPITGHPVEARCPGAPALTNGGPGALSNQCDRWRLPPSQFGLLPVRCASRRGHRVLPQACPQLPQSLGILGIIRSGGRKGWPSDLWLASVCITVAQPEAGNTCAPACCGAAAF
jgi:hypothetical protein